jgi:transcription elongation factor GreB
VNKAFVKEQDDDDEELAAPGQHPLPADVPNYITPAGHASLKAELLHLLDVDRPEVVRVVTWAASNGDRSENADYHYGKRRLREIDRRIRFLSKRLDRAQVVDPTTQRGMEQVFFGACVEFEDQDGAIETVTIVGVDETDASAGRISWISPVATALRKARQGDVVVVQTPAGKRELEILSVRYGEPSEHP